MYFSLDLEDLRIIIVCIYIRYSTCVCNILSCVMRRFIYPGDDPHQDMRMRSFDSCENTSLAFTISEKIFKS